MNTSKSHLPDGYTQAGWEAEQEVVRNSGLTEAACPELMAARRLIQMVKNGEAVMSPKPPDHHPIKGRARTDFGTR
jgi:hypothetical protein